jgi:hypothetical protein
MKKGIKDENKNERGRTNKFQKKLLYELLVALVI